jgi:hypothetical protein
MSTEPVRFNVSLPDEPLPLSQFPCNDLNAVMRLHELYTAAVYAWRNNAASYNSLSDQFCETMDKLRNEAIERGWCDEYEQFVDSLPPAANVRTHTRDKTWYGTLTYTVTFPVRVIARNLDDATDNLREYWFSAYADRDIYQALPSTDLVEPHDGIITELVSRKITGEAQ